PKESAAGETRVAATPETARKLCAAGLEVVVETGAGAAAHFDDGAYRAAGAEVGDRAAALGCDVVFKVNKPTFDEIGRMRAGGVLIALLDMCRDDGTFDALAERRVDSFALETMPRISRAQS